MILLSHDHRSCGSSGPMTTPDGQELPPSNKRMTVKSVEVIEIEDGKIKVLRHYFDLMTILQQIGAMHPPEQL